MKLLEVFKRVLSAIGQKKLISAINPHAGYYRIPVEGTEPGYYIPKSGLSIFTGKNHAGKNYLVWRLIDCIMTNYQLASETVISLAEWISNTYTTSGPGLHKAHIVHSHLCNLDDLSTLISIAKIDRNVRLMVLEELPMFSFYPEPGMDREQRICDMLHRINAIGVEAGVAILVRMTDDSNGTHVDPAQVVLKDRDLGKRPMLPIFESSLVAGIDGHDSKIEIKVLRHPLDVACRSFPQVSTSK